jgi:hypothetical protein
MLLQQVLLEHFINIYLQVMENVIEKNSNYFLMEWMVVIFEINKKKKIFIDYFQYYQ